jgi:hypothetical protein
MRQTAKNLQIGLVLAAISLASTTLMPTALGAQDSQNGEFKIGINSTIFVYNNVTAQPVPIMITVCLNDNSAPAVVGNVFVVPTGGCRTARMNVAANSGVGVTPSPVAAGPASGTYQVREAL